ncbi:hypothetical protein [Shimazuella kribbensis]|uniref:hypothetical protein n=1 Tax=Shimazuella kribbensis TaxID=139808 RepID=UPI0012EC38BF|nr:hypothetical protein [Shimazuella kribbensis]
MSSNKSLATLGSVVFAVVLATTGCSVTTYDTYSVVPPSDKIKKEKEQAVIAAWENSTATVNCMKNGFAVYKDKDQICHTPFRTSKVDPVYDLDLIFTYTCNHSNQEFLAYVVGRDDLVFCFHYKHDSQKPDPKKFKLMDTLNPKQ